MRGKEKGIGKERETATRSRAPLFPRFFISLLHLLLLFLLLSSRTPALLCLSSTLRSFVLFRAPLEGLIAAHTRSPFVSSFSPPFLRQPPNLLSLSFTHAWSLSAATDRGGLTHASFSRHPSVFSSLFCRTPPATCPSFSLSLSRTIGFYRPPPPSFTPDFSTRRDSPSFSLSFERFRPFRREREKEGDAVLTPR